MRTRTSAITRRWTKPGAPGGSRSNPGSDGWAPVKPVMVLDSPVSAIASALCPHAVAQVRHARPVHGTEQFELDVLRWHVLEEWFALSEQDRDQVDLQLVEDAGGECQLGGA